MKQLTKEQADAVLRWVTKIAGKIIMPRTISDDFRSKFQGLTKEEVINDKTYEKGKNLYYKKGDVVVWLGEGKAIGKIVGDMDTVPIMAGSGMGCSHSYPLSDGNYTSCDHRNLRPATAREIAALGDRDILILE